ncbi:hypothetical protein AAF712_015839 [Marasmius tenuissimus]|uniref:Uncharacterized protein n=1 Tax=Marasmius tenuissimus TaxID=585030 RepID=A0ABR2Z897_9AGAR
MDGNSSLKMIDADFKLGKARKDSRTLRNHRWLEDDYVDRFKDEVAKSQSKSRSKQNPSQHPSNSTMKDDNEGVAWLEVVEGDELAPCLDTCVDRWCNAGPEARKKMCALFAVAGIVLAVSHHGHLLVVCDMVRSGELMKYLLAIVDALLHMYGDDLALGYDIMCAFYKTLQRSELLALEVQKRRLVGVVPAFHGHAHNRKCQCQWHPQYIPRVGIEDFEGCKRTFSLSNNLASTTRLATLFHRQQAILEHFDFNDDDKHALSGNFIYQNYREALERLQEDEPLFEDACHKYGLSPVACKAFLIKEREYFQTVMEESPETIQVLDYAETLIEWWKAEKVSHDAHKKYLALPRTRYQMSGKQVRQIEAQNRTTFERAKAINEELHPLEDEIGIPDRWTSESEEFSKARKKLVDRRYRQALETLEKLVVQRLFELTKLNMSGVATREDIKSTSSTGQGHQKGPGHLQQAHNASGPTMTNPNDTQRNVSQFIWAKEEINRLNIELKHLITFSIDDHADYHNAIDETQSTDPDLAAELSQQQSYRTAVQTRIVQRLSQTSALKGFTGSLLPGERLLRNSVTTDMVPLPPWSDIIGLIRTGETYHEAPQRELTEDEAARLDKEHIEREAEPNGLITFMQGLTVTVSQGDECEPEV